MLVAVLLALFDIGGVYSSLKRDNCWVCCQHLEADARATSEGGHMACYDDWKGPCIFINVVTKLAYSELRRIPKSFC